MSQCAGKLKHTGNTLKKKKKKTSTVGREGMKRYTMSQHNTAV